MSSRPDDMINGDLGVYQKRVDKVVLIYVVDQAGYYSIWWMDL